MAQVFSSPSPLQPFGMLTYSGLKEVLGCRPPESARPEPDEKWEWTTACNRFNEAIFVRLRARDQPKQQSFCVSTYHMPCLFGTPEKVRVVNIHTYLLLSRLKAFAGEDPAILMGDFNFQPGSSPYALASHGGSIKAAAFLALNKEELSGLEEKFAKKVPWPNGLKSAYHVAHQREPFFTNFAKTSGMQEPFVETLDYIWFTENGLAVVDCPKLPATREEVSGPFPNEVEPSDHIPVRATFKICGPRARL